MKKTVELHDDFLDDLDGMLLSEVVDYLSTWANGCEDLRFRLDEPRWEGDDNLLVLLGDREETPAEECDRLTSDAKAKIRKEQRKIQRVKDLTKALAEAKADLG